MLGAIAALLLMYPVGARLVGRTPAAIATLALATNSAHVFYLALRPGRRAGGLPGPRPRVFARPRDGPRGSEALLVPRRGALRGAAPLRAALRRVRSPPPSPSPPSPASRFGKGPDGIACGSPSPSPRRWDCASSSTCRPGSPCGSSSTSSPTAGIRRRPSPSTPWHCSPDPVRRPSCGSRARPWPACGSSSASGPGPSSRSQRRSPCRSRCFSGSPSVMPTPPRAACSWGFPS